MPLRMIEIRLPADLGDALDETLGAQVLAGGVDATIIDGRVVASVLVDAAETRAVVDAVAERFGQASGFRLVMLPVEAALPVPKTDTPEPPKPIVRGLSREELHHDIQDMAKTSGVFVSSVLLSTCVAAIGMLRDNVAVIIGAMVIAPLLGPNVALAFGTTLGDMPLIRQALRANLVGFSTALALTVLIALLPGVEVLTEEVMLRTHVGIADVILALAAGSIGALAVTTALPSALLGVMVAVALLPPTVTLGLTLGQGAWEAAGGAATLLGVNVVGINLAGIVTFLVRGIGPRRWWEKTAARRYTHRAIAIWVLLLLAMVALIVLAAVEEAC